MCRDRGIWFIREKILYRKDITREFKKIFTVSTKRKIYLSFLNFFISSSSFMSS